MKNKPLVFVLIILAVLGVLALPLLLTRGGSGPVVVIRTSKGDIKVQLDPGRAPLTVRNFLNYVDKKHYDGTIFHRVIEDFMIQGGGFRPGLKPLEENFPPIRNESNNGLSNVRGTIAMARTGDPHSATDQFFINVANNSKGLDPGVRPGYAVFGKVIAGMDVVDAIRRVRTTSIGDFDDVPVEDVVIESIRREDAAPREE